MSRTRNLPKRKKLKPEREVVKYRPNQRRYKHGKEFAKNANDRWTPEELEEFLLLRSSGRPWKRIARILDREIDALKRKWRAVCQNDPMGGRSPDFDLYSVREGMDWTEQEYHGIRLAFDAHGIEHGANTEEHLARVFGRSVQDVMDELDKITSLYVGFGLGMDRNLKVREILKDCKMIEEYWLVLDKINRKYRRGIYG